MIDDDPGWRGTWKGALWSVVPAFGIQRMKTKADRGEIHGLLALRVLFVSFVVTVVLIGCIVEGLVEGGETDADPGLWWAVVATFGIGSFGAPFLVRLPLDCTSDAALARTYRERFMIRTAFAESAALVGFVGSFQTGTFEPYLIGAAFATVGLARNAPTRRHVELDQERLAADGCPRSLLAALGSPAGGASGV